jgi:hypothetical protein
MGLASWLVAGMIPGVNREPLKKLAADPEVLLRLLYRWRDEAIKVGKEITRIAVGYETGRDSFWLARWVRDRRPQRLLTLPRPPFSRDVRYWIALQSADRMMSPICLCPNFWLFGRFLCDPYAVDEFLDFFGCLGDLKSG